MKVPQPPLCPVLQGLLPYWAVFFFSLLSSAGDATVETFLVAIHITCQIQLYLSFVFPNLILPWSGSILIFLLDLLFLLSPFVHLFSVSELSCELLSHPCRPPNPLSLISAWWDVPFMSSKNVALEYQQTLLCSSSLHGHIPWHSSKQVPEQSKVCFPEVQGCGPAFSPICSS